MKVPAWLLFGLLIAILMMDTTTVWAVRGKISGAAQMALDAALVGALTAENVTRGKSFIDEERGLDLARSYFRQNLNLDSNLENDFLHETRFELWFEQDGRRPRALVSIRTVIKAMSPQLVGLEGVPVTIRLSRYQLSNYK